MTVIPKLEFINMDGVYIGVLIISNKENTKPVIFTDEFGNIIGANKLVREA